MLGVCYYPEHWPETLWADDAKRMRAMGIAYVRIGEFAWSRLEPEPGQIEFDWLRRAIDTLGDAGLKVVLGTPTATPPKWLMDRHPDIAPVDEQGRPRGFGSRRHYSFSSETYARESARIVELLAREFGRHAAVAGWQTDNEYGCHGTILSWGAQELKAFQGWLRRRYQSPRQLNEAWGNVFWSMEVNSFEEISLPNLTVTEPGPAARLDFWRFSSEQVAAYDKMQADIIRRHSPGRFVTHNFMGFSHDFDHFKCAENLDLASWDSYPLGFVEVFPFSQDERAQYARTSHPDIAPFHHDLYRGVGRGRWWVMEQQPGPVNWAPWNAIPRPGQIRLFTWEALAHGAEVVSYFRWRQAPFAQEQMHAGLNLPNDQGLTPGGREAAQVGAELEAIGDLPSSARAPVALVFDYEASWITRIQPQGRDFSYLELTFRCYEAVRRLGLDVDILPPGADLAGYRLVLAPCLPHIDDAALHAFAKAEGEVIFGPRSGSKTRNFAIPDNLPPGPLAALIPIRVIEVASLRPGLRESVVDAVAGDAARWRENLEIFGDAEIDARFADGSPALVRAGRWSYLACWPEADLLNAMIGAACRRAALPTTPLPEGVRLRRRGALTFAFNYGDTPFAIDAPGAKFALGGATIGPSEVAAWRA